MKRIYFILIAICIGFACQAQTKQDVLDLLNEEFPNLEFEIISVDKDMLDMYDPMLTILDLQLKIASQGAVQLVSERHSDIAETKIAVDNITSYTIAHPEKINGKAVKVFVKIADNVVPIYIYLNPYNYRVSHSSLQLPTVTDRFFEAFEQLRELGLLSRNEFCEKMDVDRRNFAKQKQDHSRRIIHPDWLSVLVIHYKVSADWLLTGRGWMFSE